MKTLIVMRHGKAMPSVEGQPDIERRLTEAGVAALEARLPHMLRLLEVKGENAQIWTSPAKRAQQTAELLGKALKANNIAFEKKAKAHECLWEQDVDAFLAELYASEANLIFAVGHVPFVEDVVDVLTGSTPSFSTGGLGCMKVCFADENPQDSTAQDSARLLWFAQGPIAADWETLSQLQAEITEVAEAIEQQREAFFADPQDIETIHHFRTNTRALRSLVAFIKPWQNAKQNAKTQAILKELVGYTSRLRELDVLEKQARSGDDSSPNLLALCKKKASAERAKVLKALKSKKATRAFEQAMAQAKNIRWKKRYVRYGLPRHEVQLRFDSLASSVKADLEQLNLSDAEHTHEVRKRAKRVRYVAERCKSILGADDLSIIESMKAYQDTLGDVCDARVNIQLINELLRRDLPRSVAWELALMRAQNETFLYSALKAYEA